MSERLTEIGESLWQKDDHISNLKRELRGF